MSSYLSAPIAGIYNSGAFLHHQKYWQLLFSLEDELAQGLVVVPTPGCTTAAHGLVSSHPKQDPVAQGRIWTHQTDSPLKKPHQSDSHYSYLSDILINFRMSRVQRAHCKIPILLWVNAMWSIHNSLPQSLFLTRSTHDAQACFGSWFESSQIFAGELLYPHLGGRALQLLGNPGKYPWHGFPMGLGNPSSQSSYTGCCLFQGQGKKTSYRFLFVCKIKKYGSKNIFFNLKSAEKSSGKMGTRPDKQQFWYECDCFKSCAQLVCASQVVPLRLISAI